MSIYAQFDEDGAQEQIATNTGWSQFGDWADRLSVDDFPALIQLWEHGHSTSLRDVLNELDRALRDKSVEVHLREVIAALHAAVEVNLHAEILLITNGMRAD